MEKVIEIGVSSREHHYRNTSFHLMISQTRSYEDWAKCCGPILGVRSVDVWTKFCARPLDQAAAPEATVRNGAENRSAGRTGL